MAAIALNLSDDQWQKLQQLAQENNVSPEELLVTTIQDWLSYPKSEFVRAASYVLTKNAELYRRLARFVT